jgi:hypothetical protein
MVVAHPHTGRRSLWVSPGFIHHVEVPAPAPPGVREGHWPVRAARPARGAQAVVEPVAGGGGCGQVGESWRFVSRCLERSVLAPEAVLAAGVSVIKCPFPLNARKDTYDHSCY